MKFKFLLLALCLTVVGCQKNNEPIIRPVEAITAKTCPSTIEYQYPGIVIPEKATLLSFRVSGPIKKLNVEVGSFVSSGTIIAEMDKRDYELQLEAFKNKRMAAKNSYEAAKSVSENAKKQFLRVETLYREKTLPQKTYDEVLASVKVAKASEMATFAIYQEANQGVLNSENQLKDTTLIAPYDGYIQKKFSDVGAVVGAGIPVVSISSVGNHKIRINVSENDLERFLDISGADFVYNNKIYSLKLEEVGKVKGITNSTYPVTFSFVEKNDIPNDSQGIVKLSLKKDKEEGIIIPCESIFEKDNLTNVWIYKDGCVSSKVIKVIKPYYNGQVIVSGIDIGEKVITKGVHELSQGQKVNLLEPFSKTNIGEVL